MGCDGGTIPTRGKPALRLHLPVFAVCGRVFCQWLFLFVWLLSLLLVLAVRRPNARICCPSSFFRSLSCIGATGFLTCSPYSLLFLSLLFFLQPALVNQCATRNAEWLHRRTSQGKKEGRATGSEVGT